MDITFTSTEISEAEKKNKQFKIKFVSPVMKDIYNNFRDVHNDLKVNGFKSELLHVVTVEYNVNTYKHSILNVNVMGALNLSIKLNRGSLSYDYKINWEPVKDELKYISGEDVLNANAGKSLPSERVLNLESIMNHCLYYTPIYIKLKKVSRRNSFTIDEFLNSIVNENVHWDADLTSGEIEKNGLIFNFKIHPSWVEQMITVRVDKHNLEIFKQLSDNKYIAEK